MLTKFCASCAAFNTCLSLQSES